VIRGIGVDAVDIQRFRTALTRTPSMRERLFTAEELAYVGPQVDETRSLAARFAARESVMKAMGVGLGAFGFHEVWVSRAESGDRGITTWHLSLTHTDLVAIAYVVAE
jgi:holo-[acyl-carrier protein] synthase